MQNPTRSKRSKVPVAHAVTSFEFRHREASQVSLAGSFSTWALIPMVPVEPGHWVKQLTLAPGRHEYRFVVDGHWKDDPTATEVVPNPYGGQNAVAIVPSPTSSDQRGSSSGVLDQSS